MSKVMPIKINEGLVVLREQILLYVGLYACLCQYVGKAK